MTPNTVTQTDVLIGKQQIFVVIYPVMRGNDDYRRRGCIDANLSVFLFKDEHAAKVAQRRSGGMLIETTSDKLKGRINEDVYLQSVDGFTEELDAMQNDVEAIDKFDKEIQASLVLSGLEHKRMTIYDDTDTEHENPGDRIQFAPEADAWVERFIQESGTWPHL